MPRYNPMTDSDSTNFVKIRPAKPKGKAAVKARKRKGKSDYVRNSTSPKVVAHKMSTIEDEE